MIDTIVVGAGPAGLCAAKTILQCDPNADVKVLDAQKSVGGVWAKEKIYPSLKTNHHYGGVDFSDFPMQQGNGAEPGKHIPGSAVHNFLCQYARRWNLEDKIEFDTRVTEVCRPEKGEGWDLKLQKGGSTEIRRCRKLIIAIGITNAPHIPQHKGTEDFEAPIVHSSQLGLRSPEIFADESTNTVAVLGGGKSAYDAAYLAASHGRKVEWIIRKSGKGPVWVMPLITKLGPFEAQRDKLPLRRIITFFSPCIWNDGFAHIRNWIHGTVIGRYIAQLFWTQLHLDTIRDCRYRTHEKLRVLEPETNPFWYGAMSGAYSYETELYDFIKSGQVQIHREDISHMSRRTIHLANGRDLSADALFLATGFSAKPTIAFNPPSLHSSLGIPTTQMTDAQEQFWRRLDIKSDQALLAKYPGLLSGPHHATKSDTALRYNPGIDPENNHSPFRLYRSIAPPGLTANGERSLAFVGVFSNFANNTRIELQCLWAYAYLNNKLKIDEKDVFTETSLLSRYSQHRTPFGHGRSFPDHVFDQLPYFDTLIQDLGLSPWRKSNIFKEIFSSYTALDYRGLASEWLAKFQKR